MGERLPEDSAVYPRLLSAEETGAWIAFVVGLSLLNVIDFRGVLLACAVACAAAAAVLLASPPRAASTAVGALVGSLAAGLLYDHGSWTLACLVAAAVILAGAVVVPWAVRSLGVPDRPQPAGVSGS